MTNGHFYTSGHSLLPLLTPSYLVLIDALPFHFHQHPFSSLIQIGGWLCHVRDGDIGKTLNKSMCKCYHENSFAIGCATFLDYSVKGKKKEVD